MCRQVFHREVEIVSEFSDWLKNVCGVLLSLLPLALWIIWWLLAVNWKKAWVVLAQGAWIAVLLLMVLSALVWSHIDEDGLPVGGAGTISALWWRVACVCGLALLALFCGWLQGALNLTPTEIELEPAEALGDGHGNHGHGHH
jgi:hypothetical protein